MCTVICYMVLFFVFFLHTRHVGKPTVLTALGQEVDWSLHNGRVCVADVFFSRLNKEKYTKRWEMLRAVDDVRQEVLWWFDLKLALVSLYFTPLQKKHSSGVRYRSDSKANISNN